MASDILRCTNCGTPNRVPATASGKPRCAKCQADLPWIVNADDSTLDAALTTSRLVVLDLWAPWCGPCRMVAPILEKLAGNFAGRIKVVKVNVDDSPLASNRFQARSIPLLVFLKDGNTVDTMLGAHPEHAIASKIESLLA